MADADEPELDSTLPPKAVGVGRGGEGSAAELRLPPNRVLAKNEGVLPPCAGDKALLEVGVSEDVAANEEEAERESADGKPASDTAAAAVGSAPPLEAEADWLLPLLLAPDA